MACQIEDQGRIKAPGHAGHVVKARDHPGQGTGRLAFGQPVPGGIQLARLRGGAAKGLGQGVHVRPCPFRRPQPVRRIRQPIHRLGAVLCRVIHIEKHRHEGRADGDQPAEDRAYNAESAEQLRRLL